MCVQVCTHACARNTHMQIHVCVTPGVLVQMHTCVLFFCLRVTTLWEMFVWWKKIDQQPDTINLKLLSFEIIDVASPGIVCDLRVKCPLLEILLICSSLSLCSPLCYRFVVFERNLWVKFPFASVRVICGRELCPLSNSRPGACGLYLLGFSGKRHLLSFVSGERGSQLLT